MSPGGSRSPSTASAIPSQPSRLVDSSCGGRPEMALMDLVVKRRPNLSAYHPSKYSARESGSGFDPTSMDLLAVLAGNCLPGAHGPGVGSGP